MAFYTTEQLYWLRWHLGSDSRVHSLVSHYPQWDTLAQADGASIAKWAGQVFAGLKVPQSVPNLPSFGVGVEGVGRYDQKWPERFNDLKDPLMLLFHKGSIQDGPRLCIIGSQNSEPVSLDVASDAGMVAASTGTEVVVVSGNQVGSVAASACIEAGGRVSVVLTHGTDLPSINQYELDAAVESGGTILSASLPGERVSEESVERAVQTAVAFSWGVLVTQAGIDDGAGSTGLACAIESSRFIMVPAVSSASGVGGYNPTAVKGLKLMSSAREFNPTLWGTNMRILQRVSQGLSPADAVVANPTDLAGAIVALSSLL